MFWTSRKSLLIVAAATAMLFLGTSRAEAFRFHHYRAAYWGCGSCWTPCASYCRPVYSTCCDPCYRPSCSSCCSWRSAPLRCRSYRCCTTTCCDPCVTWDTCCSNDAGAAPAAPTKAEKPIEAPTEAADPLGVEPEAQEPTTRSQPTQDNSGLLTIYVPYDAKVTVNGYETASKGSRRQYVSHGLKPGLAYKYEIRAEVLRDGQPTVETRTVTLTAGDHTSVAFGFNVSEVEGLAAR